MKIQNTIRMNVKPYRSNMLIPCYTFLIVITMSCGSQSQSNNGNKTVQAQNSSQYVKGATDAIRLKYTTRLRSILEDSKGNIWFGSYN